MASISSKFCILTTQRSGSTWLNDLLNSHPQVRCLNEPFLYSRHQPFWELEGFPNFFLFKNRKQISRPWGIFQYITAMQAFSEQFDAVGFKLMYSQLSMFPEIMLKMIKDRYRIIHLIRQNPLDLYISYQNARKIQKCHTIKAMPVVRVNLNADAIVGILNKIKHKVFMARSLLLLSGLKVIEINYEALVSQHEKVICDILRFINVPDAGTALVSNYKKISKGNYEEKIENFDEIVDVLKKTKFEHLITSNQ